LPNSGVGSLAMRILYKPFGIIAGVISARIATAIFKAL
jgi:hypothetical protein